MAQALQRSHDVHGDIRHLEIAQTNCRKPFVVHGDIRHLEIYL